MRNRAKCKLCGDILESFFPDDFVRCKCDEISIDGGPTSFKCYAKNWNNFLRVDDEGKEFPVKVKEKDSEEIDEKEFNIIKSNSPGEAIEALRSLIKAYKDLPPVAMSASITHYDMYSALLLMLAISESLSNSSPDIPPQDKKS